MNEKTLTLLEFDTIRERTAQCALSEEAQQAIRAQQPLTDETALTETKTRVAAILEHMKDGSVEPQEALPPLAPLLERLETSGAALDTAEAHALGLFAERGLTLGAWLEAAGESTLTIEENARQAAREAAARISAILDKDGQLRDLPIFQECRKQIAAKTHELEAAAAAYARREDTRRMLQSELPTQRDGRLVLQLKANFQGRLTGIVHEASASGQTLFIEPADIVEKNNELLLARRRLDNEIRRVLRGLSAALAALAPPLRRFHTQVIHLETLRARARHALKTRGIFARSSAGPLTLKGARHPLLGEDAIPLDLETPARCLIITGPNTGGKTVALKTVGLLSCMNQFALALPALDARLPIFDGIWADIGDEQSIAASLSTFSAHIVNLAAILRSATAHSLVLLDELGSGTDPQEGSALALALVERFINLGSHLLVTTHHGALKTFAYSHSGSQVENASMEADPATHRPTYRLLMGVPGESLALDIAERSGLPPEVITAARTSLAGGSTDVSALIAGLKEKSAQAAERLARLDQREAALREESRRLSLQELRLRQRETAVKAGHIGSLRRFLDESRRQLENLVRELREGEVTREKTLAVKSYLRGLDNELQTSQRELEEERKLMRGDTTGPSWEASAHPAAPDHAAPPGSEGRREKSAAAFSATPSRLTPGTRVTLPSGAQGNLKRRAKKGHWLVQSGSLTLSIPETELTAAPGAPPQPRPEERKTPVTYDLKPESSKPQWELNLRGLRLEAALEALQRQLDAALLTGLSAFSIVHGKGDGILQSAVHAYLKEQPTVQEYHFSPPELGGTGRTEVTLAPPPAPPPPSGSSPSIAQASAAG